MVNDVNFKLKNMKITFYVRENTIYVRAFHRKQMIRVSTGLRMPTYAKLKGDQVTGDTTEVASINSILLRKKAAIIDQYADTGDLYSFKITPEPVQKSNDDTMSLVCLMYKYVSMMESGELKSRKDTKYKPATIRSYEYAADTLASFRNPIMLTDFILESKDIQERGRIGEAFDNYFKAFSEFMTSIGLQVNTRADIVNTITTIINYWADKFYIQIPRPPKIAGYEPPIIALDDDFLRRFVMDDHKLYDKFNMKYRYIWEVTALMMVTSLRISDAVSLTTDDFIINRDSIYLVKENEKTGEFTDMPLPKSLTDKLFYNLTHHGGLFSPVGQEAKQAMIRREYKEFFKQYQDLHYQVTVKKADVNGNRVPVTKYMYEWAHPHMMRKSAITAMLANNVSEEHVKFCSGHRPTSKAFERYRAFVEKRYKSEVNNYQNKMFS